MCLTLVAGQTHDMIILKLTLHAIDLILKIKDLLQMFLAVVAEHIECQRKDLAGVFQHLLQFLLRICRKAKLLINAGLCKICDILCVISDPLNIIDYMEQST